MIAGIIKTKFYKKSFYPWVIVSIAILTVFFSAPGQTYFISGFIDDFIKEFELSRTEISKIYSIATLIAGFTLVYVGRLIDKYGHRRMTMIISFLLGVTCILCSRITQGFSLIIIFFMLRLLGQGSMVLLPSTLIPNWFNRKRAFAFSLVSLGGAIGSIVIPPINNYARVNFSWQSIWVFWGLLLLLFFIPLVYSFLQNKPSLHEIGTSEAMEAAQDVRDMESWTLGEVAKTRGFWFMVYSQSVPAFVNTGLFFHMYSIMTEKGADSGTAAMILSLIGLFSFPSTFLAGYILAKVKVHYVYSITFIVQTFGVIALLLAEYKVMAIGCAVFMGVTTGVQNVCRRFIWPEYYGKKHLGSISGFTMTALVIGSAIGPVIIGMGFDYFGGYNKSIALIAITPLVAAVLSMLSPKPRRN